MEEANDILNNILDKVAKEQQYDDPKISFKQISSGGANYTSYIFCATVSSASKPDLHLFIKVAAIGEKMRNLAPFRMFEIENFFYSKLLKIYQELEERNIVPPEHRLTTPKMYASEIEVYKETLVLEDLTTSGFQAFDRFKSIDWKYAAKSVQNLAKLHALSIAWSLTDPDEFNKFEGHKYDEMSDSAGDFFNAVISNIVQATKPEYRERIEKFLKKMTDNKAFIKYYKPIRRPVISHGDYRPSNLMHKLHGNGELEVVSVDYQTLQIGNPILDLLYFIFNGSDKTFRKHHLNETIAHYYTELRAALKRLNLNPDDLYSKEDFDFEFKEVLPYGLVISMCCLLIVTVQEEDAPKVGKNTEINDFAISPNDLYKERLNDIIDDFIDMGMF